MTEQQIDIVWNFFSYRTYAVTGIEMIKDIVRSGCKSFVFEPCRTSAMYTGAVCYKTPKDLFPRKIYVGNEIGHIAEAFSVTSKEIMELVVLYEL